MRELRRLSTIGNPIRRVRRALLEGSVEQLKKYLRTRGPPLGADSGGGGDAGGRSAAGGDGRGGGGGEGGSRAVRRIVSGETGVFDGGYGYDGERQAAGGGFVAGLDVNVAVREVRCGASHRARARRPHAVRAGA